MLVNGKKGRLRLVQKDRFGAIAVMHVKIENRCPRRSCSQSFEHCDCHRIQITKSHGMVAGGVMSRRTQQTEGSLTGARGFEGLQRTSDRTAGMLENMRVGGSVRIEGFGGFLDAVDMGPGMSAKQDLFADGRRFCPA